MSPDMSRILRWWLVALVGAHALGCFPVPVPAPWHDDDDDHHHHHHYHDSDYDHR